MVSLTTSKHAQKFREMADNLQDQIDAKLAPRQTNTWRKIQQAETAEKEGRRLLVLQDKLRALADGWDNLSVPDMLTGLSTKAQVDDLVTFETPPSSEYNADIYARMAKARITENDWTEARAALMALGDPTVGQETETDELRKLEREIARHKIPGFFPTPRDVAEQMVITLSASFSTGGMSVLEPSAGRGDLADVAREMLPHVQIDVCEINPDLRRILELKGYNIVAWDFYDLGRKPLEKQYDGVLMNPEFEKFEDIEQVMLAWQFLKPGGRLVAIMCESTFFRKNGKAASFRNWLELQGGYDVELPEGAFNQGDKPTGVKARMVVIDKPGSPEQKPDRDAPLVVDVYVRYFDLKPQYPGYLLLMRVDDQYKVLGQDANIIGEALNLRPTAEQFNANTYLPCLTLGNDQFEAQMAALVEQGHKIAVDNGEGVDRVIMPTQDLFGVEPPPDDEPADPGQDEVTALMEFFAAHEAPETVAVPPTPAEIAAQINAERDAVEDSSEMNVFEDILAILKAEGPQNVAVLRRKIMGLHDGKTYDVMFFSAAIKEMVEKRQIIVDDHDDMTVKLPDEKSQPEVVQQPADEQKSQSKRSPEEDIRLALAYPVDQQKYFTDKWSLEQFKLALSIEKSEKNRKTVIAKLERQIKKLEKDDPRKNAVEEARRKIEELLDNPTDLTHNQIGMVLSGLAGEHGRDAANDLIHEYYLDTLFGIRPVKDVEQESKPDEEQEPEEVTRGEEQSVVAPDNYLDVLEGQEVISPTFEGVVGISDGKIWKDGVVIVESPTRDQLKTLFNELFENEFGASDVNAVLGEEFGYAPPISPAEEQRVADEAAMCERCHKHRSLYYYEPQHEVDFEGEVCAICQDELDRQASVSSEETSDPTPVEGEQLPLLPIQPPAPPKTMMLALSHFLDQIKDVPVPPRPFIDSLRVVQLDSILVRQEGTQMILVDGRRRCKALMVIALEDKKEVTDPIVRADVFQGDAWSFDAVMALKANSERSHNVLNELEHIEKLVERGYTEKQIAEATGMNLNTIRKRLKLTRLTDDLREALNEGRIKPSVAEKAVNLSVDQQHILAHTEGKITAKDIHELRQVQIKEIVSLFDDDDLKPEIEPVESRLSDLELQSLIESSLQISIQNGMGQRVKAALIELRTFRARYGKEEIHVA